MLKVHMWKCPCGTTLKYWNIVRQEAHEESAKHKKWVETGNVVEKHYKSRWREDTNADSSKSIKDEKVEGNI